MTAPAPQQEPSSEPSWVTIFNGTDRIWKLVSMYEVQELMYAINESEPGHLKELHDSGNEILERIRSRPVVSYYNSVQSHIPNDEQCRICSQAEHDKVLDEIGKMVDAQEEMMIDGWISNADSVKLSTLKYVYQSLRSSPRSREP